MPITRIRAAHPVELAAPTNGDGDSVAIHGQAPNEEYGPLQTDENGQLKVVLAAQQGGAARESWSFGLGQNQAVAEYIPGSTVGVTGWPYYPSHTKWKAVCAAGEGVIRLLGRLADGTEVVHQAGFISSECETPEAFAAEIYGWEWKIGGEGRTPAPTAGQSVTVYHHNGTSWVSYMAASTNDSSWRPLISIVPEGKKVRLVSISRTVQTTGYQVFVVYVPYIKETPRSDQNVAALLIRSSAVQHSMFEISPNIEADRGALAVFVAEASGVVTYVSATWEIYDA